jgi:tRNA(Ile)-lysidine synthase
MIHLQGKMPDFLHVACSGGVDSMAAVDFLSNKHHTNILFFDHQTETSKEAYKFVARYVGEKQIGIVYGKPRYSKQKSESWEEYWRNERYAFFHSIDAPIVTAHHLDDCVETWLWSSMHGKGKIIPYRNKNVIRPFRLTRKRELELWCNLRNVPFIKDESNDDTRYIRNYIRHEMMPDVLMVNPGIHKTIAKKVKDDEHTAQSIV